MNGRAEYDPSAGVDLLDLDDLRVGQLGLDVTNAGLGFETIV